MEKETLITLTADIVSAHVGNNSVAAADMPVLIQSIYSALSNAAEPAPIEEARPEPAVSIRSSVKPDAITCLECGKKLKMLKRHLSTDHTMTPDEYRRRWDLPADYPLVAPDYAAKRRDLAVKIGLGRKPAAKPKRTTSKKAAAAAR